MVLDWKGIMMINEEREDGMSGKADQLKQFKNLKLWINNLTIYYDVDILYINTK
jgi:hypothetical protein